MLEITFLGTSAATPSPSRNLPSIALRWQGGVYIFDAGEGFQRQMMKFKVGWGSVKGIFITHLHLDHFLGVFGFLETLRLNNKEKVKIFAPKGLEKIINHPKAEIIPMKEGKIFEGKDFEIKAFPVNHGVESYGLVFEEKARVKFNEKKAKELGIRGKMFSQLEKEGRITIEDKEIKLGDVAYILPGKKVVYSGDTRPLEIPPKETIGAELLIHEATFLKEHTEEAIVRLHSTAEEAGRVAEKMKAKALVLTHISPRYGREREGDFIKEAKRHFKGRVYIAYDGMKIQL